MLKAAWRALKPEDILVTSIALPMRNPRCEQHGDGNEAGDYPGEDGGLFKFEKHISR